MSEAQKTLSRLALKIVVMTRELLTGNREQVLGNFTFRYILLFEKPLRVYGFFPFTYLTKFNPSGEEQNLNASAIVVQSSGLKYFIELRTTALIDYMLKIYTISNSAYTRKSISDWLNIRNRPGFYKELSPNLHLAYGDQRDGHGSQHWWKLFFNDDYKPIVVNNIKIEIT